MKSKIGMTFTLVYCDWGIYEFSQSLSWRGCSIGKRMVGSTIFSNPGYIKSMPRARKRESSELQSSVVGCFAPNQ